MYSLTELLYIVKSVKGFRTKLRYIKRWLKTGVGYRDMFDFNSQLCEYIYKHLEQIKITGPLDIPFGKAIIDDVEWQEIIDEIIKGFKQDGDSKDFDHEAQEKSLDLLKEYFYHLYQSEDTGFDDSFMYDDEEGKGEQTNDESS
jgi:hypothetical protein